MTGWWRHIAALLLALAPLPGAAQELQPMEDRGDLLGWEAVGRVDLGDGFCTGVLIASDLVLTAAHCVYDRATGRAIPPRAIAFRAGYMNGSAIAERGIDRIVTLPDYSPRADGMIRGDMIRHDVALMRLDRPISSSEADPFRIHVDPRPGESVSVVSYGRGRAETLSWERDCKVLGEVPGLLAFDCNVTFGSSGAPVFVRYGTRSRILSLVSSMGPVAEDGPRSFGMQLPEAVTALKARMRAGDAPALRVGEGARRITVGGGRSGTGAKFVRP